MASMGGRKEDAVERKPRPTRVQIYPIHDVSFEPLGGPRKGERLKVANLSEGGIGLMLENAGAYTDGDLIDGFVYFPQARFPATLRVVYAGSACLGCTISEDPGPLKATIVDYFSPELAADELLEVNPDILKEDPEGRPRLFRGRRNCELLVIESGAEPDKVIRFELSFFGNFVEGGRGRATKFGFLVPNETDRMQYKGSSVVRPVSKLSPEVVRAALRFLEHIKRLPAAHRAAIRDCLAGPG